MIVDIRREAREVPGMMMIVLIKIIEMITA